LSNNIRRNCLALVVLMLATATAHSQTRPTSEDPAVAAYVQKHAVDILREFANFLALPNVASGTATGHHDVERNTEAILHLLEKRGLRGELLNVPGGFPVVFAEKRVPGASKTVVFYAHYDGQPVSPEKWRNPPFSPVLLNGKLEDDAKPVSLDELHSPMPRNSEEWRLYARSASDDKASIIDLLVALDALRDQHIEPSVNLKIFFEGEEEAGSGHLGEILETYRGKLTSDLWVICDGPRHQSGRVQLVFGARGVQGVDLTLFGPNRSLHSGHYGNWAPNPAAELANLLAGLRDEEGRIRIEGFYDPVRKITSSETDAIAAAPSVDSDLRSELALGRTEGHGERIEMTLMQPALNIRGIQAGEVGDRAANAIMTQATASIDFRLVPNQTPDLVRRQVEGHFARLGYFIVHETPSIEARKIHPKLIQIDWDSGYPAARTPLDSASGKAVSESLQSVLSEPLIMLPTLGGSVPMYLFKEKLGTDAVILPIANFDNHQHSENENIRLGNLWDGIQLYAALFEKLGSHWH